MRQVTHDELSKIMRHYYNKKIALLIYGRFGIGKSEVVNNVAETIAVTKGKTFVNWNKMDEKARGDMFAHPDKYFCLIDIRLSEYDSSDIKGLPIFKDDKKSIEFKVPNWALFTTQKGSDGLLFFDEINLAPPLVMSSCYKIIYDRTIVDVPISEDWGIFGAGNLDEDRAYTNSIAPPLKDRAGEVELVGASADDWMKWALVKGIDNKIIGFLNFKQGSLYPKIDWNDKQKFTTPRGWERLSNLIKGVEDYNLIELMSASAIGEGIAKEFVAFCKINKQIDLPSIIANPEKLKDIKEISVKWFINTVVAEQYANKKVKFDRVMAISKVMDKMDDVELVAYLWKMCYGMSKDFRKDFMKGVDDGLMTKYQKYLGSD